MINIIEFSDESFESQFVPLVEDAYAKALRLLDKLPDPLNVKFTYNGASEDTGVGGFSVSDKQINFAILKGFTDRTTQENNLRGVILHESFHVQQGFTYEKSPFTALEAATYEGAALIFEQQYAGISASYGDYGLCSDEELRGWLDEIRAVGTAYFDEPGVWEKWAFYHPEHDQKWIIYKVGSWLVNRILEENNLDVLDLKDRSANEIIELAHF